MRTLHSSSYRAGGLRISPSGPLLPIPQPILSNPGHGQDLPNLGLLSERRFRSHHATKRRESWAIGRAQLFSDVASVAGTQPAVPELLAAMLKHLWIHTEVRIYPRQTRGNDPGTRNSGAEVEM